MNVCYHRLRLKSHPLFVEFLNETAGDGGGPRDEYLSKQLEYIETHLRDLLDIYSGDRQPRREEYSMDPEFYQRDQMKIRLFVYGIIIGDFRFLLK